jgi:RNA polymerase sigma-70 factor (ECF subfamily)
MTDSVTDAALDYTAFFRDEFAGVLRTIELMLRDHGRAEEITQDAFVQLYLNWPKVSRYDRPEAWVRRVAIRLVTRSVRRERLWRLVRGQLMPSEPAPPSRHDLAGAIRQLSGGQRAAIVLHCHHRARGSLPDRRATLRYRSGACLELSWIREAVPTRSRPSIAPRSRQ